MTTFVTHKEAAKILSNMIPGSKPWTKNKHESRIYLADNGGYLAIEATMRQVCPWLKVGQYSQVDPIIERFTSEYKVVQDKAQAQSQAPRNKKTSVRLTFCVADQPSRTIEVEQVSSILPDIYADHQFGLRFMLEGKAFGLHKYLPLSGKVLEETYYRTSEPISGPFNPDFQYDGHQVWLISRLLLAA